MAKKPPKTTIDTRAGVTKRSFFRADSKASSNKGASHCLDMNLGVLAFTRIRPIILLSDPFEIRRQPNMNRLAIGNETYV
jgi:hypothetical protein